MNHHRKITIGFALLVALFLSPSASAMTVASVQSSNCSGIWLQDKTSSPCRTGTESAPGGNECGGTVDAMCYSKASCTFNDLGQCKQWEWFVCAVWVAAFAPSCVA